VSQPSREALPADAHDDRRERAQSGRQPSVEHQTTSGRQSTIFNAASTAANRPSAASRRGSARFGETSPEPARDRHEGAGAASARRQVPAAARQPAPARGAQPRALNLDRLIHERLRLGIVSALAVNERLSFTDLKRLLDTTDGNLSVHARKLEEAQYIACDKSFEGRVPRTEYRLTAAGRRALEKYLVHMEALIKAVRE
jgi:DNA-binding HxlR family transcriptional regulator